MSQCWIVYEENDDGQVTRIHRVYTNEGSALEAANVFGCFVKQSFDWTQQNNKALFDRINKIGFLKAADEINEQIHFLSLTKQEAWEAVDRMYKFLEENLDN